MRILVLGASSLGLSGLLSAALEDAGHEVVIAEVVEAQVKPTPPPDVIIVGGHGLYTGCQVFHDYLYEDLEVILPVFALPDEVALDDLFVLARILHAAVGLSETSNNTALAACRTEKAGVWHVYRAKGAQYF